MSFQRASHPDLPFVCPPVPLYPSVVFCALRVEKYKCKFARRLRAASKGTCADAPVIAPSTTQRSQQLQGQPYLCCRGIFGCSCARQQFASSTWLEVIDASLGESLRIVTAGVIKPVTLDLSVKHSRLRKSSTPRLRPSLAVPRACDPRP